MRKEVKLRESIKRNAHGDKAKEAAVLARYGLTVHKNRPPKVTAKKQR
jgi:hypothetical protein